MRIFRPRNELKSFVRYYWVLESNETLRTLTFPIGCPQMIFHRRTPLYIPELDISQSIFTISGQVNFPCHIQSSGDLEMIVAVFYPHTIGMFIGQSPLAFYNQEISGFDIGNKPLSSVAQEILESTTLSTGVQILESWLIRHIEMSVNTDRVGRAVAGLLSDPSLTVNELAESVCLSKKQFERIFSQEVGMFPKEYSRIVRFQRALYLIQSGESDYAGIAADCGYSDQSHLIREFKKMSGLTPRNICRLGSSYSDLYTNPI